MLITLGVIGTGESRHPALRVYAGMQRAGDWLHRTILGIDGIYRPWYAFVGGLCEESYAFYFQQKHQAIHLPKLTITEISSHPSSTFCKN